MATTKIHKVLGLALAGLVLTSMPQMVAAQEGTPKPEGTKPEGTKPEGTKPEGTKPEGEPKTAIGFYKKECGKFTLGTGERKQCCENKDRLAQCKMKYNNTDCTNAVSTCKTGFVGEKR